MSAAATRKPIRAALKRHLGVDKYGASSTEIERWVTSIAAKVVTQCSEEECNRLRLGEVPDWLDEAMLKQCCAPDYQVVPAVAVAEPSIAPAAAAQPADVPGHEAAKATKGKSTYGARAFDAYIRDNRSDLKKAADKLLDKAKYRRMTLIQRIRIVARLRWKELSAEKRKYFGDRALVQPAKCEKSKVDGKFLKSSSASSSTDVTPQRKIGLADVLDLFSPEVDKTELRLKSVGTKQLAKLGKTFLTVAQERLDGHDAIAKSQTRQLVSAVCNAGDLKKTIKKVGVTCEITKPSTRKGRPLGSAQVSDCQLMKSLQDESYETPAVHSKLHCTIRELKRSKRRT